MSNCSKDQDENITKYFQRTPGTPTKVIHQTPRKSNRKRALFQPSSPINKSAEFDDLGLMSPLSSSSTETYLSHDSPHFSPNGKFSTPPETPGMKERFKPRKIEITSTVYNNWKLNTPKSHRSPVAPRRSQRLTPSKNNDNGNVSRDVLSELATPPRSSRRRRNRTVPDSETDSSQKACDSTPRRCRNDLPEVPPAAKRELFPIPAELFYGPSPPLPPKPPEDLGADTLCSKLDSKKRYRSLSLESVASNRSFVSGSGLQKRKKMADTCGRPRASRRGQKGPHAGVWHAVKKPKKMKFANKPRKKPLVSPKSRVARMINYNEDNQNRGRTKRLFEEKPRRRIAKRKKDSLRDETEIIDSFPHNLIKRNRLSSSHPSKDIEVAMASQVPDPNKKFMKYGAFRKATFTLNDSLKLQFSDGVMKLQSPKKRRKLFSGKSDVVFDFCEEEEEKNAGMKENIENILSKLEDETRGGESNPKEDQIQKISEDQLVKILNSPGTKICLVNGSPGKVLTEIQNDSGSKLLANMSSLAINESRDSGDKGKSYGSLGQTGSMLSRASNILSNDDSSLDTYPLSEEETDDRECEGEKYFSLFYKENWNGSCSPKEDGLKSSTKKKSIKVPDDQYLLDAGQKSVGIVTCGKCGVMYQAGDFADEATHRNFHHRLPELRFQGWANERVVGRFPDGRVIMITSADPKPWWQKVTKIVDIVDQELGFPEGSVNDLFYKTVYFYISDKAKQIVGCLIAEECREAFKMFPPLEGVEVDSCSKDPSPCKVGISRIWTALNHRRRGVAKRMIECMRSTFFFGGIVPMDYVAFSVPSPSGKLLAQSVTGKLDFLVYGFP